MSLLLLQQNPKRKRRTRRLAWWKPGVPKGGGRTRGGAREGVKDVSWTNVDFRTNVVDFRTNVDSNARSERHESQPPPRDEANYGRTVAARFEMATSVLEVPAAVY